MKILAHVLLLMLLALSSTYARADEVIGRIHTRKGDASILRGSRNLPAKIGTALNRGDVVRTGKPGAVGIVLSDDTSISLGPNSELAFREYAFIPKEKKMSLVVRMAKGTFSYLSGLIGKLAPDAVQLLIPDATIAIRGTKLLVEVQE